MRMHIRAAMAALALIGVSACAMNPPPGTYYVRRAPPPRRVEVVPVAPVRGEIWIAGHWAWQRNDYAWVAGRWAPLPSGEHQWVAGHWDHNRHGWFYVEGHWR
jgi:WXXGXW repeat (2 copies)